MDQDEVDPLVDGGPGASKDACYRAAFKGLTSLRLNFNSSNAQVGKVKEMCRELISCVIGPMHAVLQQRLGPYMRPDAPPLATLMPTITDVFSDLGTAFLEGKARKELLPQLQPSSRVLGEYTVEHEMADGRTVSEVVQDIVYDFNVKAFIEALFEAYPDICEDFLSSIERWKVSQATGTISDDCDGLAFQAHPLWLRTLAIGGFVLLFQYYMDGVTLTNPLGAANGRHKVAACYVVVLNFNPLHRTSPHCIIPVCICYEKDFTTYPPVDIVCGPIGESATDGTSFGAQMERLYNGIQLRVPSQFSAWPEVRMADGVTPYWYAPSTGGLMKTTADTPAASLLFGTKISVGPTTVSICRGCYCKQIDGDNKRAHCCCNSFLPWRLDAATGERRCEESDLVNIMKGQIGAFRVHTLRTVDSAMFDMNVFAALSEAEGAYYMQQIGVRTFLHAFSRLRFGSSVDSIQDFMHIELLGNGKEHLSKLLWKMHRELGWLSDAAAFNNRVLTFSYWIRGSRRKSYLLLSTAFAGPLADCSIGGLWTAHNMMIFMCFSIELLSVFIPAGQENHPVWQCWCLHYKYFMMCLQSSFTLADVCTLDSTILDQQKLFLHVYGDACWLPKNHYAQHFALDILKWGPMRLSWCMMFEYMNQVVKFSGLRSNFWNTTLTTSSRLAEKLAFDMYCKTHLEFLMPKLDVRMVEECVPGTSAAIDFLVRTHMLTLTMGSISVSWLSKVRIGRSAFQIGDYVIATSATGSYVALVMDLLQAGAKNFIQLSVLVQVTPDAPFPPLTWADLSAAARVHFNATEFIEINQISLTLLHPLSRTDTPNAVHFLSW